MRWPNEDDVTTGLPGELVRTCPHQLSGGMRQRVAPAMALICEPALLIADEPTTAVDVTTQELRARLGMAMILVTHDFGVIARRVDRVAVMYAGRTVERAGVRDLAAAADPGSRASAAPLGGETPSAADPPSGCRFRTRCPQARDVCAREEPVPAEPATPGHQVACHFPLIQAAMP
ncbi:oligopeptide/dipeptide ABC transporter ATP-binding protein [Streptomyces sp. NPDC021212]|uniref:oligopeptide/dipeptide ABC transporter ATP-binding protein n=1 Tax=Streptomyces sp. NPDC021212 TaxID=3365118 RepID=UPI00379E0FB1